MKKNCLTILLIGVVQVISAQNTVDCNVATSESYLHINEIKAYLSSSGQVWSRGLNNFNPSYIVNANEDSLELSTIFTSAIWLGAVNEVNGDLKVAATTYRQSGSDFWPGPINNETETTNFEQCNNYDRHWKVNQTTIDNFKAGNSLNDEEIKELYDWPGKGNPHLNFNKLNQVLAPFYDLDGDDIYNPDNGDYPKIKGDQAVWWLINDIGNLHTETGGEALGVEIKKMTYAFADEQNLKHSTFLEVEITNKSNNNYEDFLFGYWIDYDLGNFGDDFVGCDTLNALGYVYNGDDFDDTTSGFGYEIPIQGCHFLDVPKGYYGAKNNMFAFVYYNGDFTDIGEPHNARDYYTYLLGKWKNENPITYGGNGANIDNPITRYMFSGNPANLSQNVWSECNVPNEPADRRIIMSSGKYKFTNGETKIWTLGSYTIPNVGGPCPDISPVLDQAKYAKTFFENFILTDVETDFINEAIMVFPNPAKSKLYFDTAIPIKRIEVYSLDGKRILQKNINHHYLNVEVFSKGLYYVKLFSKDGKVYQTKFVKE